MKEIDRTNQTFGKLKVLGLINHTQVDKYWRCYCACGRKVTIKESAFKEGVQSCGCIKKGVTRTKDFSAPVLQKVTEVSSVFSKAPTDLLEKYNKFQVFRPLYPIKKDKKELLYALRIALLMSALTGVTLYVFF